MLRITRPANMFVAGDPDTTSRPAIITMGGVGEVGTNPANIAKYGPHYWLVNGWDGGVMLGNGKHYPIIISVQASEAWPQTTELCMVLTHILKTYHIKRSSVHMGGLSMGSFSWTSLICHQKSAGDETGMKLITSLVALEGQSTGVSAAAKPFQIGGPGSFDSFGYWATKYKGKFFGLEGTGDFRQVAKVSQNMNASAPGSAYFSYESIGGGAHCCWNSMYDPSATNWTSVGTLGPNNATGADPNTMGTYKTGESIFQWMLRQGDSTLVGSSATPVLTPPTVSAGTDIGITLPTSTVTLTGTATPASGTTIASYAWSQVSGPTASITTPGAISTTVTGLTAGTCVFMLTVTSSEGVSATSNIQVTVSPAAGPVLTPPTVNAGTDIGITLPTSTVTLTGTATPASGTTIASYAWSQVSGPTAIITTPGALSTTVTSLTAGTCVFMLTVTSSAGVSATSNIQVVVNTAPVIPPGPPSSGLVMRKVAVTEYRTGYLYSDSNFYSFYNKVFQKYDLGARKVVDVATGFNLLFALDDQGYVWMESGNTTPMSRVSTDATGGPFNNNVAIYGFSTTYTSIRTDGSLWLWGTDVYNLYGGAKITQPVQLSPAGMKVKKVVMGGRIIVLTQDGQVYDWTNGGGLTPVKKNIPRAAVDIFGSAFNYQGCIIPDVTGSQSMGYPYIYGGEFSFWGGNTAYNEPTSVKALWNVTVPIKEIAANANTIHYIDSLGRMFGIGDNSQGELGNGVEKVNHMETYSAPYSWTFTKGEGYTGAPSIQIAPGIKWKKIFAANFMSYYKYALDENDSAYSWGRNKALALGNGFINLQEQFYPNSMDILAPKMVTPIANKYQAYNFTLPTINAGSPQTITGNTVNLSGTGTPARLIKASPVAVNGIDAVGFTVASYKWTQISGPAGATITTPGSAATTVTGLTTGTYVFNLQQTDNNTGTISGKVTVTVSGPAGTPVANAGADQVITLPTNNAVLNGSGSETGGTIMSYAWSQLTGPSTATLSNGNLAQAGVSGLLQGVYTFQLLVTDKLGVTATATVKVTVNPAVVIPGPPSANAGADQSITLPTNTATLKGSGTETNGTIVSYAWTQLSGPSTATIATPGQAQTNLSGLIQGVYTFQLTVKDNSGVTATDVTKVTVNPGIVPGPPSASAGNDQVITLPANTATLTGSGTETNGTIVSYTWTQLSGPSTATIATPGQAQTNLSGLIQGVYTFQLTVKDNSGVTATDVTKVTVNPALPVPGTPVVDAGSNQAITLPTNTVTLAATASETGGGTIVTYAWTQSSGPSTASIVTAGQAQTVVNALVQGVYTFQIIVTDNSGVQATDIVKVTVNPAPVVAGPPVLDAGTNQVITLPVNTATLKATASETGGTIISYTWTQLSGPSTATIVTAGQAQTTVSSLLQGAYSFQVTVKDNSGVEATDAVKVTVNPAPVVPGTPSANAGTDQVITLPINYSILSGSGSETNGTIVSYAWVQKTGPSTATINNAGQSQTGVTNLVEGVYTFQLTVTDNSGIPATDLVQVTVNPLPANKAPIANPGPDQSVSTLYPVSLDGSASSDPDGTIVKYEWSQASGAGGITLTNATTATPTVYGILPGVYEFLLTVTDDKGDTGSAKVKITVTSLITNMAPVADAGTDTTIIYPASTTSTLDGSKSYAKVGSITSYSWKMLSGPSETTISNADVPVTNVGQLNIGDYQFVLTVKDDKNAVSSDTVLVHVQSNLRNDGYVKLYPNPITDNQINVEGNNDYLGQVKFSLYDAGGRMVRTVISEKKFSSFQQRIPVTGLGKGVYFLSIQFPGRNKPETFTVVVD
ncbi:PKD domain-containing protein [Flavitalea flava]